MGSTKMKPNLEGFLRPALSNAPLDTQRVRTCCSGLFNMHDDNLGMGVPDSYPKCIGSPDTNGYGAAASS